MKIPIIWLLISTVASIDLRNFLQRVLNESFENLACTNIIGNNTNKIIIDVLMSMNIPLFHFSEEEFSTTTSKHCENNFILIISNFENIKKFLSRKDSFMPHTRMLVVVEKFEDFQVDPFKYVVDLKGLDLISLEIKRDYINSKACVSMNKKANLLASTFQEETMSTHDLLSSSKKEGGVSIYKKANLLASTSQEDKMPTHDLLSSSTKEGGFNYFNKDDHKYRFKKDNHVSSFQNKDKISIVNKEEILFASNKDKSVFSINNEDLISLSNKKNNVLLFDKDDILPLSNKEDNLLSPDKEAFLSSSDKKRISLLSDKKHIFVSSNKKRRIFSADKEHILASSNRKRIYLPFDEEALLTNMKRNFVLADNKDSMSSSNNNQNIIQSDKEYLLSSSNDVDFISEPHKEDTVSSSYKIEHFVSESNSSPSEDESNPSFNKEEHISKYNKDILTVFDKADVFSSAIIFRVKSIRTNELLAYWNNPKDSNLNVEAFKQTLWNPNFRKRRLRIAVFNSPPYTYMNRSQNIYAGIEYEILKFLLEQQKWPIDFRFYKELSWSKTLNDLKQNLHDIATGGHYESNILEIDLDSTKPYAVVCGSFLVPKPKILPKVAFVFQTGILSWLVILIEFIILMAFIIIFLKSYSKFFKKEEQFDFALNILRIFITQPLSKIPKEISIKLLIMIWTFTSLLHNTMFSAGYTSALSRIRTSKPISSFEDMLFEKVKCYDSGSYTTKIIKTSFNPVLSKLGSTITPDHELQNLPPEACYLANVLFDDYVFPEVENFDYPNNFMRVLPTCFHSFSVSFGLRRNSPFTKILDRYIDWSVEHGFVIGWFRKVMNENMDVARFMPSFSELFTNTEHKGMGFSEIIGVVYLLLIGYGMAFVAFCYEYFSAKWL